MYSLMVLNPGRPPRKWWRRCVRGVTAGGSAVDPASVCGATWARKSARERRAAMRRYENPGAVTLEKYKSSPAEKMFLVKSGQAVLGFIRKFRAGPGETTPWQAFGGWRPPFNLLGSFYGRRGQERAVAEVLKVRNPGPAWHRRMRAHYNRLAAADTGAGHSEAADYWLGAGSAENRAVSAGMRRRNPVPGTDPDSVRELDLYAENTYALYNQFTSIIENLKRKIGRGVYDPAKAPRLWQYWYDNAAKSYKKEFGHQFSPAVRKQAALERAAEEFNKIMAGEYGEIPVPKRLRKKNSTGCLTRGVQGLANPKRKTACAGYRMFHDKNPDRAYATKVPKGFPRRMWYLGRLHKLVLKDGRVLKGGVVAAGTGNSIFLLGVKGNVKKGRVARIEYVPPKNSRKSGAVYYHPFKSPPSIKGYGRGYHRIAGRGVRLTPRGIIG